MAKLAGKVAIITGASSGIGASTAQYFASLGCKLVLGGRNVDKLKEVKQKCHQAGASEDNHVVMSVGDVVDEAYLKTLVDVTLDKFKQLDILVNCAGIVVTGRVEATPTSEYDRVSAVNVRSVISLCQLCIPHLVKSKGTIVNVSSINGPCSFPGVTYYCMSKAALDQFTKCLALELAPQGVRVNAVNPGVTVTDAHRRAGMAEEQYQKFLEHSKTTHALGRVADALEVAKAITFLASDDSSFTTGELLRVDGGRGLMTPR